MIIQYDRKKDIDEIKNNNIDQTMWTKFRLMDINQIFEKLFI